MISPIHYTDFYKTDHRRQYPKKTELVYSNLTARTNGIKKSAKGLLSVRKIDDKLQLWENVDAYEEQKGLLEPVFVNGRLLKEYTLAGIRSRLKGAS